MPKQVLKAENVSKTFEDKPVFKNLSLCLYEGEMLCLTGASGIGKTTLFNLLSGLIKPDEGRIFLGEQDITGLPGQISFMQQKDLLLPYYTVLHNTALPLLVKGMEKIKALAKAEKYFPFFGLEGYQELYPHELSGGMRQRAALLRTYMQSQQVVLLDEPFGALDAATRYKMQEWYLEIAETMQLSTIFITHDLDEAILLSDRILVLGGQPAQITAELKITYPHHKRQQFSVSEDFIHYKKDLLSAIKGL
ncbi:MAG: ABC transporter ATP-binding protein [Bacillota bacterium]|jgi:ABC-type nitrate/sulfonate/bicarbonate transport system ATPase subunit